MIDAISSASSQVAGVLLALANPRAVGQTRQAEEAERKGRVSEVAQTEGAVGKSELTDEEKEEVQELKKRDAEVRRHEQAHKASAGSFSKGAPTFEYETGPDGRQYAVGGEVNIDTSKVPDDPDATIRKMQTIQRAANAPAEPSSKDRQVAAKAAQVEQAARAEKTKLRSEGQGGPLSGGATTGTAAEALPGRAAIPRHDVGQAYAESPGRFIDVRA